MLCVESCGLVIRCIVYYRGYITVYKYWAKRMAALVKSRYGYICLLGKNLMSKADTNYSKSCSYILEFLITMSNAVIFVC
jgi:hypothetical protein